MKRIYIVREYTKNIYDHLFRHLFKTVNQDIQSNTGKNLYKIHRDTGVDPCTVTSGVIRNMPLKAEIPEADKWRIPLLRKLLERRRIGV